MQQFASLREIKPKVENRIKECLEILSKIYKREFAMPSIDYMGVNGTTGATANIRANKININYGLMVRNFEGYIKTVIPHEVAHLVCRKIYGFGVPSHGMQWAQVMRHLGLPPIACHSYDTSQIVETYNYTCGCYKRVHKVSKAIHNKMQKGQKRSCRDCGKPVVQEYIPYSTSIGARTKK